MYRRMVSSELYQADDEAIARENARGWEIMRRYNATGPSEDAARAALLKNLLGHVGAHVTIRPPFYVDYGRHISVGDHVFMNWNCQILDTAPVIVGDYTQLAPGVTLATAHHPIDPVARGAYWECGDPITIGKNVWLGTNVVVLPGVTIGDNTVVGAGSIVTRDLPANVVAVGSPARVVRDITEADRVPASKLPADATLDYAAYPDLA